MASAEPDTPAAFDAAQMLGYLAEVDELLFVDRQAVGVIEAKKAGGTLAGVEPQTA